MYINLIMLKRMRSLSWELCERVAIKCVIELQKLTLLNDKQHITLMLFRFEIH